jgi:ribosome-binding protein aMBF1 (putative translation factor)
MRRLIARTKYVLNYIVSFTRFPFASGMEIKQRFGVAVMRLRGREKISQEELASRIKGVDQAYISRVETGQVNLSLETAEAIATALGVDLAELLAKPQAAARR